MASVGPPSSSSDCTPSAARARSSSSSGPLRSSSVVSPSTERNPPRLSRRVDAARVEARIVGAHGSHPDRDGVDGGTQLVHEPAGLLARHPAPPGNGDAPVERDRDLVRDERTAERGPRAPRLVLPPRGGAVEHVDLDAGRAQPLDAAGGLRVRIERPDDHACDARRRDRVRARRRPSVVRARLERDEHRRAARTAPACASATVSAWSTASYSYQPSPTTSSPATTTAPTSGWSRTLPRPRSASSSARSKWFTRALVPAAGTTAADPRGGRSRRRRP